jgi:hypothetical protein
LKAAAEMSEPIILVEPFQAGLAQALGQDRVFQQPSDRRAKIAQIIPINQKAGSSIGHDFCTAILARSDTGSGEPHGFQVHESKAFLATGHGEKVALFEQGVPDRGRDEPRKEDGLAHPAVPGQRLQSLSIIPVPDDDKLGVWGAFQQFGQDGDQLIVPLVPFGRRQATDDEYRSPTQGPGQSEGVG